MRGFASMPILLKVVDFSPKSFVRGYFLLRCQMVQFVLGGCFLMTVWGQFGPQVKCVTPDKAYEEYLADSIDEFCWTERIYTIVKDGNNGTEQTQEVRKQELLTLYNWITPLCWAVWAVILLPYFFLTMDGGSLQKLSNDFDFCCDTEDKKYYDPKKAKDFVVESFENKLSSGYFFWYFVTELAAVVSVALCLFGLDYAAKFSFSREGFYVFSYIITPFALRTDKLAEYFPVEAMCKIDKVGHSGSDDDRGTICVLPANLILERFCLIAWVFLCLILACDMINGAFRLTCYFSKRVRCMLLSQKVLKVDRPLVKRLTDKLDFSTWFLINEIGARWKLTSFRVILDGMNEWMNAGEEWQDTEVKHTLGNALRCEATMTRS